MVDKKNIGISQQGLHGEQKAALAASLAGLDGEEFATVESLGGKFAEKLAVERRRNAGGGEQYTVDLDEVIEVPYHGRSGHGGGR